MKRRRIKRSSNTRIVTYGWSLPDPKAPGYCVPSIFDEGAMDKLLYAARAAGVIVMHDAGRGAIVWFQGTPGAALRALRDQVLSMLPTGVVSLAEQSTAFRSRSERL